MIHIFIIDPAIEIPLPEPIDRRIASQADYVAGYDHISRAIHAGINLRVLVMDKTVGRWLKVMVSKYGSQHITIEEMTPRGVFQDQTGLLVLPEDATDERILSSGLLDLKIPATPGISFEDYILEVFFGNFLTLPNGLRRVSDIIYSYEPEQWQDALSRSLVKEIYRKKVRQLRKDLQAAGEVAELQILDWLDTSPELLTRNLAALKLLSSYPERLGKRVLGKNYPELLKLKLDLRKIPIVLTGNEKVLDEISLYLDSLTDQDGGENFAILLNQVSGFLENEFDSLFGHLTTDDIPVTDEVIRKIQEKFKPLVASPRLSQALAELDLLISKEPPPVPEKSWQASEWIEWAVKHYLPYRFWLENTGQLNDQIGEIASTYADWLYENYGKFIYHSEHMAWKSVLNLKEVMKSHQGPVLVVVVDNLNAKFYPELHTQMQKQGYFEHSLSYCFSMLPSCTEVSKKCLITGHYAPFNESAYQFPVETVWTGRLGRKVKYLANIGEFRLVLKREYDVYFLNYLPLDITLHQSENQTGLSHAQAIRSYLDSLTQDIRSFARRIGAERDLMVVVISDHGSTRIPKGTVNVVQGKFYKERALDEHHRYISVSDDELTKLPKNSKYDCYLFDRKIYELNTNYLIARRYYRFLPTDESVYIHGGLTPEETLVPIAIYHPVTISPKPLTVSLIGSSKIYIGTKLDLTLEITNLNNYACEQVLIEFPDPNLEVEKQVIGAISKLQRVTLNLTARCPRTTDPSAKKLQLQVAYRFLGQPWEHMVYLPIEIVEPAKAKFDIDNI